MKIRKSFLAGAYATLGLTAGARADANQIGSALGNYTVQVNSTLTVPLFVTDTGSESAAAQDIEGMTLILQLGTGSGTAPTISGINFSTGNSIWNPYLSNYAGDVTANPGAGQYVSYDVLTDDAGEYVNLNGIYAAVTFNTTGATVGKYALTFGGETQFDDGNGDVIVLASSSPGFFTAGTLSVTAVPAPEPTSASLAAVAAVGLIGRRRRSEASPRARVK